MRRKCEWIDSSRQRSTLGRSFYLEIFFFYGHRPGWSSKRNRSFHASACSETKLPWNILKVNPSGRTWTLPNECICSCFSIMYCISVSSANVEPMSRVTCDVKLSEVGLNIEQKLLSYLGYLLAESL